MEINCIKDLNIENLKGAWRYGDILLEITPESITIRGIENPFQEHTDIKYLEGENFVQISNSLTIKQIFRDDLISISYLNELYTFKKGM